jgi:hypothetical protein
MDRERETQTDSDRAKAGVPTGLRPTEPVPPAAPSCPPSSRDVTRRMMREIVGAGAAGGLVAGLAMALVLMVSYAITGPGPLFPLQLIAATLWGHATFELGGGAAIAGLLIHLVVSAGWGVLFAAMLPRGATLAMTVALALIFSMGVFVIMTYLVLPWTNWIMWDAVAQGWFFLLHLVYGAVLVVTLPLRHRARYANTTSQVPASALRRSEV